MNKILLLLFSLGCLQIAAQTNDAVVIKQLTEEVLSNGKAYTDLRDLCKQVGNRISGSPQAEKAVQLMFKKMKAYGFDSVWLQPVMVPRWTRGSKKTEIGKIVNENKPYQVNILALGGSVSTPKNGLTAGVIEVKNFEELHSLGKEKVKGKIVFFNRPMDPKHISTGAAYGGAVNQRGRGASEAAKLGAIGVVVRSMTLAHDDFAHTGAMHYNDSFPKIPACAISSNDADRLSLAIKNSKQTQFYFNLNCANTIDSVLSYNVIGQINGTTKANEIILVGGHLDSWDVGEGAHDDGAGCVQSIEVLRLFKTLHIKTQRTIRAVLFMNEENGLRGGVKYAALAAQNKENHYAAIETDAGGFVPRGFGISDSTIYASISAKANLFREYGWDKIDFGGGGADIGPLKNNCKALIGFTPDSQRYFDYHHTENDVFEHVNERELHLGAAAIASLVWLLSNE
ncbi:MAG: M28 family peptidase [Bacteroidota bacterium]